MKSFTAMFFGSIAIAALFFTFVLLSNASALRANPIKHPTKDNVRERLQLRAKQIRYMCPDRYYGGQVQATKWNVVHLVCIRSGR